MRRKQAAIAAVLLLAVAPVARAQTVAGPLQRADVSATLGWLNADKGDLDDNRGSNDWYNRSLYGGAGLGWYWTDHWKTEIDGGASTSADLRVYSYVNDGRTTPLSSTYAFATRRVAIGQQYQFGRNVWVHPFAGAGIDLTWEQTDRTDEIYSSQGVRTTTHPRRTEWRTRPFATFGLKVYVGPRAFFRTDMKLVFDKGIDEALFRFGLGVDF